MDAEPHRAPHRAHYIVIGTAILLGLSGKAVKLISEGASAWLQLRFQELLPTIRLSRRKRCIAG